MATVTLHGLPIHTAGDLPKIGSKAPEFKLTKKDLTDVKLSDYLGYKVLLNIFPSIDTGICAMSVRRFNAEASNIGDVQVLCISRDLPFAHARFCGAEGIDKVESLSILRDLQFGKDYGTAIIDGPMAGLMARVVIIIDEEGLIKYVQVVPEIGQEPDYESALNALK
ncbi:MAG TPA: thiol peroxidase [Candidatus Cloacimonadota bacterium]|nr:thiol peroxidase [Candidatus Cloacimonadota bacterium]